MINPIKVGATKAYPHNASFLALGVIFVFVFMLCPLFMKRPVYRLPPYDGSLYNFRY